MFLIAGPEEDSWYGGERHGALAAVAGGAPVTGFLVTIGVVAAIGVAVLLLVWVFGAWADRPDHWRDSGAPDWDRHGDDVALQREALKELRDSGYQG